MALSVNLLTDVAQCDAVLASLDERLRVVGKLETDADYQRDGAMSDAAAIATRLAKLPGLIAGLTADLAAEPPGIREYLKVDLELGKVQVELKQLTFSQTERGPVLLVTHEAYIDEAEDRLASLNTSRAAVVARRAVLAAA